MADPKQPQAQPSILDSLVNGAYNPLSTDDGGGSSVPSPLMPALSSSTSAPTSTPAAPKGPTLGTQDQLTAASDNADRGPAAGGSWSDDGRTLTLPQQTRDNSSEPLSPEEHVGILKTIGRLAGGAVGLESPNSSKQANLGSKIGGLIGRTGAGLALAAGTPEQKQLAEEQLQTPMKMAQIANEMQYRNGMLGINQQKADTAAKTEEDKYALGDTAMGLPPGTTRMMAMAAQENANSNTGLRAAHQKQIEASLNGEVFVMPEIAHAIGRPELAGKNMSPIQYQQQVSNVLKSLGVKNQDLGVEGVWGTSPITGRITRLGDSPSVARANAVLNRPWAAYNPETNQIETMSAGQAEAGHLTPAGAATQIMSKQAQFADIYSGIGTMRSAINEMAKEGGASLSAGTIGKLVLAMRETDPTLAKSAFDTILGSEQLTPAQQDFVVATQQLNERALSLRNLAGMGNASDSMRAAIRATLPSAKSGDISLMRKQLDAVTNLVDNLHTGIPNVNTTVPKKGTTAPNSSTGKPLTLDEAKDYLKKNGNDPVKARAAAKKDGRTF